MPEPVRKVAFDVAAPVAATPTWTRRWSDPLGRSMSGAVTLTRMGRPAMTVTADLDGDGRVALPLSPGHYRMVATLFDADRARSYDLDIVHIS